MSTPFHCGTCGLLDPQTNQCMVNVPLQGLEDPKDGYCHNHTFRLKQCECCGAKVAPWAKMIYIEAGSSNESIMICPECNANYGLCATCAQSRIECNFQIVASSPGLNIPPIVQEVKAQGNMQMVANVRNPQLMESACAECPCYSYMDKKCLKDTGGGCIKYQINSLRN